jgi:hypothetical protein
MDRAPVFSVDEARAALLDLMPTLAEFIEVRADVAELGRALAPDGRPSTLGGAPELRALQARLDAAMRVIQSSGVQVKGFAPLLLDFPSNFEGEPVLLCWLEGDLGLSWYHRVDLGFPGRRPLPFDA